MLDTLGKCSLWGRLLALGLSIVWLFFVWQFLELRPDLPSRQYLKAQHEGPKNYGVIRLSTLDFLLENTTADVRGFNL